MREYSRILHCLLASRVINCFHEMIGDSILFAGIRMTLANSSNNRLLAQDQKRITCQLIYCF
jgi:hypothetical protein